MNPSKPKRIHQCRISKSDQLVSVLNLGEQYLTGVFPKKRDESITKGPLELVWCPESGLLQLAHCYPSEEMYGDNYGYRSGLNRSMVTHLSSKVKKIESRYHVTAQDVVLDIGSNDGTLLNSYKTSGLRRIGIDPTVKKFKAYYADGVEVVPQFFSKEAFQALSTKPAKVISSIAMFYDLEEPVTFAQDVYACLADDGIWHFEQSYMPSMLSQTSYDTVCHEHVEYYSLSAVQKILAIAGFKILDVELNDINGGSFAVTVAKQSSRFQPNHAAISHLLEQENRIGIHSPQLFRDFEEKVFRHREDFTRLIHSLKSANKKILGYGASTKGNVLLQFCGLSSHEITAIIDVNPEKEGRFTPGTHIPIISEREAHALAPDYLLVLPWHFRNAILQREKEFLRRGGKFIFPLPNIEIIGDANFSGCLGICTV